ncbi:hypothetical protein PHLGIDRAFT_10012 [Phlebiopsis gigantea 11061_1 CR5-6]|uniref:Uncharacterized protein n=1 Tax=Phlebiopsis gigantea (strain 11061_1 CR5-6) TaxID=745531 RepID=A0A0C3SE95_PHLG1|nr:hypothetical protein PHLGIDRAFT_10012 [Phlebiopsis gigantea 11061_1 CR5-6]
MSDASSIRLAYDEPERPVVPPEPSPHSRRSFYDNDYPVTHSHSSGSGMGSKKKLQKSRPPPLRGDHKSGGNTSYSSSKSSSASSFARSQSGDPPLSARSKSSLHVANPSPEDEAQQPYTTFNPRHSYHSSTSSISSSDEPHTPPSAHGHFDHTSSYSSSRSREEKGYLDDKRLKEKDKAVGGLNHTEQAAAEAPPAYTALPTPTEVATAAGPIRRADSKIEYSSSAHQVQVTLTPEGMYLDPLEPSTSYASSNSGRSHSSGRKVAGPSTSSMSADVPRPALQANSSAPELHVSPPRDIPSRPTTVAVPPSSASTAASMANTTSSSEAAPPVKKTRSRKHSAATPPGNLDKIDELDETDPLGLGWHNSGPYDAIPKVSKAKKAATAHGEGRGAKIFAAQAGMDPHHGARMHPSHRANVPLDPATTSFAVKPGQIFPPILAPQPYMRPDAMPMVSQAPFSPPQRHAFMNAHMQPSAARGDDIPPLFSPTPSEMARAREPPADRRTSVVVQPEANWSGVGTPYASSQSEGHHSSSTSGSSVSGHSAPRGAAPPAQQYPMPQQPPPPQHHFLHRPQPNPVQTSGPQMQQPATAPQLKPQSSRTTLSRSHSAPHTPHTPTAPLLSSDPPPTPDIQLPPPSTHAPSVRTQGSAPAALPPNPRYMPRQLVMPTPLQHARAAPAGGAREERGAGGAAAVWAGRVVVVPEEAKKKEKGGLGAFLFGGGAKEKEREREREKERVMMERARETKERERERGKKLSKARR